MSDQPAQEHDHPACPERLTPAGWNFQREYERLIFFIVYVTRLAEQTDENAKLAVRALYESSDPDKYREKLEQIKKHGAGPALRKLHRTLVLEMMLCRAADNFLAYITELLAMVFRTRPETLRSSETVRLDAILKHTTMEDLIHDLAERRVNRLSYQGMRDLSGYLSDRLGFELLPDPQSLERAVRIIESRNLIVHNRGYVNEMFVSRVAGSGQREGEPLDLDSDQVFADVQFLAESVYTIDSRAVAKFRLPVCPREVEGGAA